ncbi:hypothetical protein HK104_000988 [Borealophlyctis nickersoniae]|nr:hypothetical protein HK104_000988 [Borealophlyctis nickersoniae]
MSTPQQQQPPTGQRTTYTIGTRESQLALVQARHVQSLLSQTHPTLTFTLHGMTTTGDKVLDVALSKIGSKSLFTKELDQALYDRAVDLVVHSLKDVPTQMPDGMVLGAMTEREDPRDAVIMKQGMKERRLEDLEDGSVIGTSSRGNLNTRLKKLDAPDGPYAALILAYAGVHRLGWDDRITQLLSPPTILHAVGQGALGIQCRDDDVDVINLMKPLDHLDTRLRCMAERAFMRCLEGGCSVPLGVWTEFAPTEGGKRKLKLVGSVTSLDGSVQIQDEVETVITGESYDLDVQAASELGVVLGGKLIELGARKVLDEIKANKPPVTD